MSPRHRSIIYRPDSATEILLVQPVYRGPSEDFCWLIPLPSRPTYQNIFSPSQEFINAVFERISPVQHAEIIDPSAATANAPDAQSYTAGRSRSAPVNTRDCLQVGDYSINILAPRAGSNLAGWLKRSGYVTPDGLEAMADGYIKRGWCFLAVKVYPVTPDSRTVLKYLRPLGIRFKSDTATYPVSCASIGTDGKTAIELVVMAPRPVLTDGIPCKDLRGRYALEEGQSYETYRAKLAGDGMVREAVVKGVCAYSDLHYNAAKWTGVRKPPWNDLWGTMFFASLPENALTDISFVGQATDEPFQIHIYHKHTLPAQAAKAWLGMRGRIIVLLLVLVLSGALIWAFGLSASQRVGEEAAGAGLLSPISFAGRLLMYSGALLLLRPAVMAASHNLHLLRGARQFMSGQLPLGVTALWAVFFAVWALATLHYVVRSLRIGDESKWLFWTVAAVVWLPLMATVVFIPSEPLREGAKLGSTESLGAAQLVAMLMVTGFAALLAYVVHSALSGPRVPQLRSAEFGILFAASLLVSPFVYGGGQNPQEATPGANTTLTALSESQQQIRAAVREFREDCGCYPESIEQLTEEKVPKTGVDDASNRVRISAKPTGLPYLAELPVDPLTGTRDDWRYHPLMPGWVTSGSFAGELTTPEQDAALAPELARYWTLPQPGPVRVALGPIARMIWGEGDALLRLDGSIDATSVASGVTIRTLHGAVVALDQIPDIAGPRLAVTPGGTTLVLSSVVKRSGSSNGAVVETEERTALFEVSGAGHRLTPLGVPIEGRAVGLYPSPDGVRTACVLETADDAGPMHQLWSLGPSGEWEGPLARNVTAVAWHPSASYLLALVYAETQTSLPASERSHKLARIELDGSATNLAADSSFKADVLLANYDSAFVVNAAGKLSMVPLGRGKVKDLDTGPGQVVDAVGLSTERTAVLMRSGAGKAGQDSSGALMVFDRRGKRTVNTGHVAPKKFAWRGGRIIGQHESTGFFFLHLWRDDPMKGTIVIVGEDGMPAQEIAVRR